MPSFFKNKELYQKLVFYLGSSWVLLEATGYFLERYSLPDYYFELLIILLFFGLISLIINEIRKNQKEKPHSPRFFPILHALNIFVALFAAFYYYTDARQNEIRHQNKGEDQTSIAILPFANTSPEGNYEWLSDGLCDQIIDHLNYIDAIDVKSRSASFYFKGKDLNPVQIANLLGVNTMLEGSVMVIDSTLRISVKLFNPLTGSQLWNETFDRIYKDILDIQSEIALAVAEKVNANVTRDERERITSKSTDNLAAREAYLKGKYHYNLLTPLDNNRAKIYFEEAIGHDPGMAEAYAYLGMTYNMFGGYWLGLPPDSAYAVVNELANKSLELDPELALGHFLKANYIHFYQRDFASGLLRAQKAFQLAENKEDIIWLYSIMLAINKMPDKALQILLPYRDSNPTSPQVYNAICGCKLIQDGKNFNVPKEEILTICDKTLELDPTLVYSKYYMAELQFERKEYEAARQHYQELVNLYPAPHFVEGLFRTTYYSGDRERANTYFNQLKALSAQVSIPYIMTRAYATLGDTDQAIGMLEDAYEIKDIEVVNIWLDGALDPIRDDPRFQEILSRLEYAGDNPVIKSQF
ncbi:MAG: tetratricopeptide repeat protein [Robiginitalea sp.]